MAVLGDAITDFLSTVAQGTVASTVDRVVINTRYGPQIVIAPPAGGGEGGEGGGGGPSLTQALQPEILLYLKGKSAPSVTYAPYGSPGETQWPWMRFVALFGLGTISYFTFKGVTRRR